MWKIKLAAPIRRSAAANVSDVRNLKDALGHLGYYDINRHGNDPFTNDELFLAIEHYQRTRGIPVTGELEPGDKTEDDINKQLPKTQSPIIRCPKCGAPHGGVAGKLCPDCAKKESN